LNITFRLLRSGRWRYTRPGRLIRCRCFFLLGNGLDVVWLLLAWSIWLRRSIWQLGRLIKVTRSF